MSSGFTCWVDDWRKPWVSLNADFLPPKLLGFEFLWRCSCILLGVGGQEIQEFEEQGLKLGAHLIMASTLSGEVFMAGWRSQVGNGMCLMLWFTWRAYVMSWAVIPSTFNLWEFFPKLSLHLIVILQSLLHKFHFAYLYFSSYPKTFTFPPTSFTADNPNRSPPSNSVSLLFLDKHWLLFAQVHLVTL